MITRHARDVAADLLRQLAEGMISNDEYERRYPAAKDDSALQAIFAVVWLFYSDTSDHTLTGQYSLNDDNRLLFQRCILFLKSDLEFQWPLPKLSFGYGFLRLLGLGHVLKRREEKESGKTGARHNVFSPNCACTWSEPGRTIGAYRSSPPLPETTWA